MSFSGKVMTDEEEILYQSTYDLITDCTTVKQTPEIDRSLGIEGTWWIYSVGMKNGYNLLPDKPKEYPFVCPVEGCDTIQISDDKNLWKNCYKHENGGQKLIMK